jgi:hypothetical protein
LPGILDWLAPLLDPRKSGFLNILNLNDKQRPNKVKGLKERGLEVSRKQNN